MDQFEWHARPALALFLLCLTPFMLLSLVLFYLRSNKYPIIGRMPNIVILVATVLVSYYAFLSASTLHTSRSPIYNPATGQYENVIVPCLTQHWYFFTHQQAILVIFIMRVWMLFFRFGLTSEKLSNFAAGLAPGSINHNGSFSALAKVGSKQNLLDNAGAAPVSGPGGHRRANSEHIENLFNPSERNNNNHNNNNNNNNGNFNLANFNLSPTVSDGRQRSTTSNFLAVRRRGWFMRHESYGHIEQVGVVGAIVFVVLLLVPLISSFYDSQLTDHKPCTFNTRVLINDIIILVEVLIIAALAWNIRQQVDGFYIKLEFRFAAACGAVAVIATIVLASVSEGPDNVDWNNLVVQLCLMGVFGVMVVWPLYRSYVDVVPELVAEVPESISTFQGILDHPKALKAFEEFLFREFSVENILFYLQAKRFSDRYEKRELEENISFAKRIVSLFLEPNSHFEVNLPHNIKDAIVVDFPFAVLAARQAERLKAEAALVPPEPKDVPESPKQPYYDDESVLRLPMSVAVPRRFTNTLPADDNKNSISENGDTPDDQRDPRRVASLPQKGTVSPPEADNDIPQVPRRVSTFPQVLPSEAAAAAASASAGASGGGSGGGSVPGSGGMGSNNESLHSSGGNTPSTSTLPESRRTSKGGSVKRKASDRAAGDHSPVSENPRDSKNNNNNNNTNNNNNNNSNPTESRRTSQQAIKANSSSNLDNRNNNNNNNNNNKDQNHVTIAIGNPAHDSQPSAEIPHLRDLFGSATANIYNLMKTDPYPRFLASDLFTQLVKSFTSEDQILHQIYYEARPVEEVIPDPKDDEKKKVDNSKNHHSNNHSSHDPQHSSKGNNDPNDNNNNNNNNNNNSNNSVGNDENNSSNNSEADELSEGKDPESRLELSELRRKYSHRMGSVAEDE